MQLNQRLDVNGSDDKPYPQERNFTVDATATMPSGMGIFVPQKDNNNVVNEFGQRKYARREGAKSIYKDETRQTQNDKEASNRGENMGSLMEPEGENKRND
jgi:hypothetical protein